jgi:hypothetical protein
MDALTQVLDVVGLGEKSVGVADVTDAGLLGRLAGAGLEKHRNWRLMPAAQLVQALPGQPAGGDVDDGCMRGTLLQFLNRSVKGIDVLDLDIVGDEPLYQVNQNPATVKDQKPHCKSLSSAEKNEQDLFQFGECDAI